METSLFDQVLGLPVHPLVVHAVVVLLPLAALGLVAEVLVPALRRRYAGLTVLGLAAGTGAAFVAKESGEALARTEGLPAQHSGLGSLLPPVAAALLVAAVVWWFLQRRTPAPDAPRAGQSGSTIAGLIAAVLAVVVTVLTVLVGHSGATAAWNPDAARPTPTASATPSATPASISPTVTATPTVTPITTTPITTVAPTPLTMAAVREHATASSCWAVVDGNVYDLTSWIARHPGGPQRILNLCGTDATAQFTGQHGTSARPNETLAGFKLGPLAA